MAQTRSKDGDLDTESEIVLGLLNAVQENEGLTQRSMASELGIALGMANAYLKRCVRKGYIKVRQIPSNRYAYYLTPKGFSEKSRLTAQYLSSSFTFFRRARSQCGEAMSYAAARGWTRIALAGVSDLAEIATLCEAEYATTLVGIFDPDAAQDRFADLTVSSDLAALGDIDAVIVTDAVDPQGTYERLVRLVGPERVLTLPVLRISRDGPRLADDA